MPAHAAAQDSITSESVVCSALDQRRADVTAALQKQQSAYLSARQKRLDDKNADRSKMDVDIATARMRADEARAAAFELLLAKRTDAGYIAAAEAYRSAVEAAVTARRASFDAARFDFRAEVDAFSKDLFAQTEERMSQLVESADSAFTTANASCNRRRPELAATRTEFIQSLKTARTEYSRYRTTRQDYAAAVKSLIQFRTDAYKKAVREFQVSMLQAREAFAAAKTNE